MGPKFSVAKAPRVNTRMSADDSPERCVGPHATSEKNIFNIRASPRLRRLRKTVVFHVDDQRHASIWGAFPITSSTNPWCGGGQFGPS